jgi:phosphate starvation-inducible PhoH-like protein
VAIGNIMKAHIGLHLTQNQAEYVRCLRNKKYDLVIASGPAGTGKTKLAVDVGLDLIYKEKQYKKMVVTRPVVHQRDDIGFMPGDLKSKMTPWIMPILDAASENYKLHSKLDSADQFEIVPFSFMRGRTFKNAYIICDETQNCTTEQLLMLLTRIGCNSKMVITGDPFQCDIHDSGFLRLLKNLEYRQNKEIIEKIGLIQLKTEDIKRHELIPFLIDLCKVHV